MLITKKVLYFHDPCFTIESCYEMDVESEYMIVSGVEFEI